MFGKLFSSSPRLSPVAKFCFDLVNRNRFEASGGRKDLPRYLPIVYATHPEFIGSVLGVVEFGMQILDDSTPQREITRQVMDALFGDNASKAYTTASNGIDNPPLMDAFEQVVGHLEWAAKLPGNQTEQQLKFLTKFF